jgi:hypothetical protein
MPTGTLVPPRITSPQLNSIHLNTTHLTSTQLTLPHLTSPQLASTDRTSPHSAHAKKENDPLKMKEMRAMEANMHAQSDKVIDTAKRQVSLHVLL